MFFSFRDPKSSRRGLLTFVARLQIETEVQMKLRRFQYQRVSNVTSSNDVKIKSEEETFPCLRQAGEGSSSFLSHAKCRGLPSGPSCECGAQERAEQEQDRSRTGAGGRNWQCGGNWARFNKMKTLRLRRLPTLYTVGIYDF